MNLDRTTLSKLMGLRKFETKKFIDKFRKKNLNNTFSGILVCDKITHIL